MTTTSAAASDTATAPTGSLFTPISPTRVLDTRNGTGGTSAPVQANKSIVLDLSARVPATATAVTLNVTVVGATMVTYVTVYPDGAIRPTASNVNLAAGRTRPNAVTVALGANRKLDLYNFQGTVDLVADLAGYYATGAGAGFTALPPDRVLDTRNGTGTGGTTTPLQPDRSITLDLSGQVPTTATAVTFNLTGVDATMATYVTAWPDNTTRPTASSLNLEPGDVTPNLVTVALGADHKVDLYNFQGTVDLVADLAGYYTTGAGDQFFQLTPERAMDTRSSGAIGPGDSGSLTMSPWMPSSTTAAVFNLTATDTTADTYVSVWPQGQSQTSLVSNLNLVAGQTAANLVTVAVGQGTADQLFNFKGSVDLIADLAGYFAPPPTPCTSGCVYAWGDNTYGQLGNGTTGGSNRTPQQVLGLSGVNAVTGGEVDGYALANDGSIQSWGLDDKSGLGNRNSDGLEPTAGAVYLQPGWSPASAITSGGNTAYALLGSQAYAWGDNADGEYGTGWSETMSSPTPSTLTNVTQLASGYETGYALTTDGHVYSWGANAGELGNGSYGTGCDTTPLGAGCTAQWPVQVSGLSNVVSLAADWDNAFAVESDGSVWAWGWNAEGELGVGTAGGADCYQDVTLANCVATAPVKVSGLGAVTKIVGGVSTAYALRSDGTVMSWGWNQQGELGTGAEGGAQCASSPLATDCYTSQPQSVTGLSNVKDMAAGRLFGEALKADGTVWTWGDDTFGELAAAAASDVPTQVVGLSGVSAIGAGGYCGYAVVPAP